MESPTLSLTIENGRKKGATLECRPGDQISIGRIVRGNALSIKDPSISQKHLAFRFLPELNRWAVTDLNSSNGTYVNGALISPEVPSTLVDGDVIRIGEKTSIVVHVFTSQDEPPPFPRRGRLGRRAKAASSKEEVAENENNEGRGRTSGRKRTNQGLQSMVIEKSTGRVTRASARARSPGVSDVIVVEEDGGAVIFDSEPVQGAQDSVGAEVEELPLSGQKEALDEEVEDHMDRMTTDEWFDRMEEYLPKTINMVAERIIAKLSDKARQFDEYVVQTLNASAKLEENKSNDSTVTMEREKRAHFDSNRLQARWRSLWLLSS